MGKCNLDCIKRKSKANAFTSIVFPISAGFTEFVNVIRYSALYVAS